MVVLRTHYFSKIRCFSTWNCSVDLIKHDEVLGSAIFRLKFIRHNICLYFPYLNVRSLVGCRVLTVVFEIGKRRLGLFDGWLDMCTNGIMRHFNIAYVLRLIFLYSKWNKIAKND
jgi:hypothetical protein